MSLFDFEQPSVRVIVWLDEVISPDRTFGLFRFCFGPAWEPLRELFSYSRIAFDISCPLFPQSSCLTDHFRQKLDRRVRSERRMLTIMDFHLPLEEVEVFRYFFLEYDR